MLERLIKEMKAKGDVWFPTGRELAEWTRKKQAQSISGKA